MVQRFNSAKNVKTAQLALMLNIPGSVLLLSLCCFLGLVVFARHHSCDPLKSRQISSPNQILSFFILSNFTGFYGAAGICLSALFAASLSSVSSLINSLSLILWEDYFKLFSYFKRLDDSKSLRISKVISLSIGLFCTALAICISLLGTNLIQISVTAISAANGSILGVFLMGYSFSSANKYGALLGSLAGFLCGIWLATGAYILKPAYNKLAVSTAGCTNTTFSNATSNTFYGPNSEAVNMSGFSKVYSISYFYFAPMGIVVTLVCGLIVSCLTNRSRLRKT